MHLDAVRVPRNGLVHGVVENLGGQMMQRTFVRAADIHAGPAADGLKPLQHLDVLGRVLTARRSIAVEQAGFFGFSLGACHTGLDVLVTCLAGRRARNMAQYVMIRRNGGNGERYRYGTSR